MEKSTEKSNIGNDYTDLVKEVQAIAAKYKLILDCAIRVEENVKYKANGSSIKISLSS